MPKVNCLLERCKYCIDTICTAEEITLAENHYCSGGCDDGWEFEEDDTRNQDIAEIFRCCYERSKEF